MCLWEIQIGKPLFRRTVDGGVYEWKVENDAPLCTLQEAFEKVEHSVGFNVELKFDDLIVYEEEQLTQMIQQVLEVVALSNKCTPRFCKKWYAYKKKAFTGSGNEGQGQTYYIF